MTKFRFVTALSIGAALTSAEAAAESKIVDLSRRYSRTELDAICMREGGSSYGTAQTYGCTKGSNVVACGAGGRCRGYLWMLPGPGNGPADLTLIKDWPGNAELILEMPAVLPKSGLDGRIGTPY